MKSLRWLIGTLSIAALGLSGDASGQGFSPEEALKRMQAAEGFQVKLCASEPEIRQPLSLTFDERGRMWVIQYLQYPNPAGLKPVQVDQYLRTVFDRLPEPPPKGPRGADRITILEDRDGSGRYRKVKDFVTGLNMATGLALGHGGVFIAQPPYLLFYPDRDRDDTPDGDPEVLLTGFGMEDSHAYANSLQWGPDGWLYGAHGSTVTAKIRGIEFQQGIWRFRPPLVPPLEKGGMKGGDFELFAEGGGNTWGLDFDRHGNVIAGTNWGGKTMLHQVQGGYYVKGFAKHGPLHNPFTFGYFEHVPYRNFKGGHVTCGGIVYQGDTYPAKYHNQYIAGNLLSNALYWHVIERQGSSFVSRHGGDFLVSNDSWFRPIDCLVGPDGSVYVADWYDKRANHVDPVDNWDRSNGRIYRIEATAVKSPQSPHPQPLSRKGRGEHWGVDLAKHTGGELVELLSHRNVWFRREARRLLAERRDAAIYPTLKKLIRDTSGSLALEALWALYSSGGFDETQAPALLQHANEDVRAWTVRFLGDTKRLSPQIRSRLIEVARTDGSPTVRSQLACTAKRLPGSDALPIARELLGRGEDVDDQHIPLLLWWAIEDKAISDRAAVLALFESPGVWQLPLVRQAIVERLGRRYMAEGNDEGFASCSRLLALAPSAAATRLLIAGMEKALEGRRLARVPQALERQLADLWTTQAADLGVLRFAVRLGSEPAYARALQAISDSKLADADRASLIELVGQIAQKDGVPIVLQVLRDARRDSLRSAALTALQPFPDPRIADAVLEAYPQMSNSLRGRAQSLLASRPATAVKLLEHVDGGRISPKDIPLELLQQVRRFEQEPIQKLLVKHWGSIDKPTTGEMQARIRSIAHMLGTGKGDRVRGHALFTKHCATCHTLFGEGNKIGPDLTSADRKSTLLFITNVVNPNAMIRPEFAAHIAETIDGRVLTGLIVESTPQSVTLVDAKNVKTVLARSQLEKDGLKPSPVSLMPEKALDPLDEQEIRDLFGYMQGDEPQKK